MVNLDDKNNSQLIEGQYHYVSFCNIAGLRFWLYEKKQPAKQPNVGTFRYILVQRLGKKNAQNVGFEHFGTFWYPGYAEREGTEPSEILCFTVVMSF